MFSYQYNYHTHTARCHHAVGNERDYIEIAVKNGITDMGFSDHAPFVFPDGHNSGYRVDLDKAEDYVSTLQALREEYRDKIRLHIGFEMEYYPLYFPEMLAIARRVGAEYLILGQHFIQNEHPNGMYSGVPHTDEAVLKTYVDEIIEGIQTGMFSYVAHPDICRFIGSDDVYDREYRRLCIAAREQNIPLEINLLGIRDHRTYPSEKFFRLVGEEQAPVVVGFDAHDPQAAYDGESLKIASRLIDTYSLRFVSDPQLLPIR